VTDARAVGRSDLGELGARLSHHVGDPEPTTDLDQFSAADEDGTTAGQRGQDEEHGGGAVVHDQGGFGAGGAGQEGGGVGGPRAAQAGGVDDRAEQGGGDRLGQLPRRLGAAVGDGAAGGVDEEGLGEVDVGQGP